MRGRLIVLVCLAGLLVTVAAGGAEAIAAVPHRADGNVSDWVGDPTMLAGVTRVSRGELIQDDYLYDDYGADLNGGPDNPVFRGALDPTRGDYRYPTNATRYGYNAADLRELRVAADGHGLHLVVFLETMKASDAAAVTVAIDDGRADTQGWPDGIGIQSPSADNFITFWGTGGWITDRRGRRTKARDQAVNLTENAIEVDVPWRVLPNLRGRTVQMYAATGLADAAAGRYLQVPQSSPTTTTPGTATPGSGSGNTAVFDLGFDANEVSTRAIGSHWGEERQSAALAAGDISEMGEAVDLGDLEAGLSDNFQAQPGRFYNRIFRSARSYNDQGTLCTGTCVNEGIRLKTPSGNTTGGGPDAQFLSPYQPYGLYIPAGYQPGTPAALLINGHSLDVNHNEYAAVAPNLFNQLGDQRSSFVITPLARGTDTWYIDSAFEDVLEAWNDLEAHYSVDDDRTSIGGYSMGGYMTYRMGLLMPDRFAAAAAYVGPPAYQLWPYPADPQPTGNLQFVGQTNNIITNGLDLAYEINDTAQDELVPAAGARRQAQTFQELGRPHTFYFYPAGDHFALILADEWSHTRDFLNQHPSRNLNQIEVSYRRYPAMDLPSFGHRFDGAYWVDGMTVRSPSDSCSPGASCQTSFGQIDAVTFAFGGNRTIPQNFSSTYPGPPFPADVTGTNRVPAGPITQRNGFDAVLTNLSGVSFDVARMGLDPNSQITGTFHASGQTNLIFVGDFPPVTATLAGQPVSVIPTPDGILVSANLNGQQDLVITPQ